MSKLPLNLHSFEHGGKPPPHPAVLAPAGMLLPFLRYPLGYEVLHPVPLLRRIAVLYLLPSVLWFLIRLLTGTRPADEGRLSFDAFIVACLAVAVLRFAVRAIGNLRGFEVHSSDAGYSFIARILPLPVALTEQLIVPALIACLGWAIANTLSVDLGLWLMVSAASYFLLANWEWRNLGAQRRTPVDDKLRAQGYAENIDQHEGLVSRMKRKAKGRAVTPDAADTPPDVAELASGRRRRK